MEVILFFVWPACALLAAFVGMQKGRSGLGWFLMGLMAGPVALLVAMAMGENWRQLDLDALEDGKRKRCPYCDEIIRKKAAVCRYCARDVPLAEPTAPVEAAASLKAWNG